MQVTSRLDQNFKNDAKETFKCLVRLQIKLILNMITSMNTPMTSRLYLLIISVLFFACNEEQHLSNESQNENLEDYHERETNKLFPAIDHFEQFNYPEMDLSYDALKEGLKTIQKQKSSGSYRNGQWIQQGPGNLGGRINSIELNPSNSDEMLLGYSLGGIFKTINNGDDWYPVFDDQINLSISDIKYDPNNSTIIYAGTGDHNITGFPYTGIGLFKSVDEGNSWFPSGLSEAGIISEISISPANSNVIYAASMGLPYERTDDRGLYKSTDGGDTWEHVLFINDSTGVLDIEVHPDDENIVYATTWTRIRSNGESLLESEDAGVYKTTDGGETWERLTNGLPTGSLVKPGISMFEDNPDILYASFVAWGVDPTCSTGYNLEGIYKTIDGGETWARIPTGVETGLSCSALGGFGWYFGDIRVHPEDQDIIYILGVRLWKTENGGSDWFVNDIICLDCDVHADKHDLVFDQENNPILATDGGAYTQMDDFWFDIENIVATQFYRVAVSPFIEDEVFGGAQDNGTTGGSENFVNDWPRIFGGDGFQMVFNPIDPNQWFLETQNGNIRVTNDGGQSYSNATQGLTGSRNWDMQYIMSAVDPEILYTGTDRMFRSFSTGVPSWNQISGILIDTTTSGISTSPTISTLDESPVNSDILYCGTTDGLVWRSLDFGATWERINDGLPRRYISDIKASRSDENTVYVTVQGYRDNDNTPYIYRSNDNGDSWTNINGNLPQIAINDILLPPDDEDDSQIFVATDGGIFFTREGGEVWELIGENLPIVPIYDLAIKENILVAGTYARGIYTFDLEQLDQTSTVELSAKRFEVFPSVASDIITIETEEDISTFVVVSSNGQVTELTFHGNRVDLSSFTNGLYFIGRPDIGYEKVVVQR